MFKTHASRSFLICLSITFGALFLYVAGALDSLEWKSIDVRFLLRGPRPVHPSIAVVAVDEGSIEKLGRWPWPRETQGRLVDILSKGGAKSVAFDVLFTEPDVQNPASDAKLADSAARADNVVSAFFYRGGMDFNLLGHDPLFPIPSLARNSYLGFVNLNPDPDGVCRRGHLYAIDGEEVFPSIAVAALARAQGKTFKDILPELPVMVDKDPLVARNEILINITPEGGYPLYPAADVLSGKISPDTFKDKIILVGGTATALFDVKAVSFTALFPGVLLHANIIDNLLTGRFMKPTPGYLTILLVLLLGLVMGLVLPARRAGGKLLVLVATAGVILVGAQWAFTRNCVILPVVAPLLTLFGCYGGVMFYHLVVEEREKRKIKGSFRQYLSPKIIDIITKDPSKLRLGGEEREVSVFFLDIAGFTTMSEALKPTQLVEVMNLCLTEFSRIILKHDGLINKYIGDCIMAFWNAPADQPGHASMACKAALECIAILPDINKRLTDRGLPRIDCRVGVNTGTVVVGNMGSDERFDYTVLGDPVNLASRLEGANKQYHTRVMVSDTTFDLVKNDVEARDLDLIRVKGKQEPRKVFEVLCLKGAMTEEMEEGRKRYHHALSLYRKQSFEEAIEAFETVFDYLPNDHVTRVYLERARAFVAHPPPPAWDGVYEMLSK